MDKGHQNYIRKNGVVLPNFLNPAVSARAWADLYERNQRLYEKNQQLEMENQKLREKLFLNR